MKNMKELVTAGVDGLIPFRPSEETSKLSVQGTEDVSTSYYPLLLRSCLGVLIPLYFQVCACRRVALVPQAFRNAISRKDVGLCSYLNLTSQHSDPHGCMLQGGGLGERGTDSVFASVLEMLLKLCIIHPADFS